VSAALSRSAPVSFEYLGGPKLADRDAPIVIAMCEQIVEDRGRLDSSELWDEFVKRSRPKNSPTHHLFEWDPAKQSAIYLRDRARDIITQVRIVWEDAPDEKVRALPTVIVEGKRGPYPMQRVLTDRDMMKGLIEQAKLEADQWARRYQQLCHVAELRGVFAAIRRMTKK
jgi:hypothetical protein